MRGYAPTLCEIQQHFGWGSPTAARDHVGALIREGFLRRGAPALARAFVLTDTGRAWVRGDT